MTAELGDLGVEVMISSPFCRSSICLSSVRLATPSDSGSSWVKLPAFTGGGTSSLLSSVLASLPALESSSAPTTLRGGTCLSSSDQASGAGGLTGSSLLVSTDFLTSSSLVSSLSADFRSTSLAASALS